MIGILLKRVALPLAVPAGLALALLLATGWGLRVDHLRAGWRDRVSVQETEQDEVVQALAEAAENPALAWSGAARQARALGQLRVNLEDSLTRQNASIAERARAAAAAQAEAAEWQAIARRAQAQRRAALRQLEQMELTPAARADCETLLVEAVQALDLAREAGL